MHLGKVILLLLCFSLFTFTSISSSQPLFKSFEMISNGYGLPSGTVGFDITTPPAYPAYSADWYRDVLESLNSPPSILALPNGMQEAGGWYFIVAGDYRVTDHATAFDRWTRRGENALRIGGNSYEIRFTESGGKALMAYSTESLVDVPFELWFLSSTPNDITDDVRMIPFIWDTDGNDQFSFVLDHWADTGNDDPYSDFIYFRMPYIRSPGQEGYDQFVANLEQDPPVLSGWAEEHLARVVLMNWDTHQSVSLGEDPVNAMPEVGTIFRINTNDITAPLWYITNLDLFNFTSYGINVEDMGSGLGTINILQATNAQVNIGAFTPGTKSVSISITKINPYQMDFSVYFEATDVAGNVSTFGPEINLPIHNVGNAILLLQPNSTLGTLGSPFLSAGVNGYWPREGGIDHLFSGGLWIGSVINDDKLVVNNAWGVSDWTQTQGSKISITSGLSDQIIGMTYDDQSAISTPIGLRVNQQSYQWSYPGRDDFIIFSYNIENTGQNGNLTDLYASLFLDPDVGDNNDDMAGFDSSRGLLYSYDSEGDPSSYIGIMVLGCAVHSATGWDTYNPGDPTNDQERLDLMIAPPPIFSGVGDLRIMITSVPFKLNVNDTHTVYFGMVFGNGLSELYAHADIMQQTFWGLFRTDKPRKKGYWSHQFNVYITGNGNAKETLDELNYYIDRIHERYTIHFPIFENTNTFDDWYSVLNVANNAIIEDKAKAELAALLFNMISLKLSQNDTVTVDNRTAGDVLTYVSELLSDNETSNDYLARDLAKQVNTQKIIEEGLVNPSQSIYYKVGTQSPKINLEIDVPDNFALHQNYPNPFNPSTTIAFDLPKSGQVTVKIYNILGEELATLVSDKLSAGSYSYEWDARELASGIYLYRLHASDYVETRKMVLMR